MTIRETISGSGSHQLSQPAQQHRQGVRYFALAWMGLTLFIGALTFMVVYAATGIAVNRGIVSGGGPGGQADSFSAVLQITATAPLIFTNTPAQTKPAAQQVPATATTAAPTVAAPASGPTPTVVPIQDNDFDLGIAIQNNVDAGTYKNWVVMAGDQLKLNWVKAQVVWRDMEKVKGQIDFSELDAALPQLAKANLKVMVSIAKAPDWARDKGANNKPGVYDGPPSNPQDLATFTTAVLKRYPGMIHAVEVFNEVNLDREWSTAPQNLDAARYVQLLKAAHDAIKAVDPNIIVISSALSPTGANLPGQAQDDFIYMDRLIQAGMLNYVDCVGAHHNGLNVPPTALYNNIPERTPRAKYRGPWDNPNHSWSFRSTLEGYEKKIAAAGSKAKLCITEFGWPTVEDLKGKGTLRDGFGFVYDNTVADQATFTDQAIDYMQKSGFVRLAFLFNLNYGAQVGWSLNGAVGDNVPWSILGPDFHQRPVWQKIVDRNFRGQARKATPAQ